MMDGSLFFSQGSDAWDGDVSAALVSWQWWPGAACPLPFYIALHLVSRICWIFFPSNFYFSFICTSLVFFFRLVVLSVVLFGLPYGTDQSCSVTLVDHGRGYLGILVSCLICESAIMWLSMRGSILYTQPREAVQYVIYIRLGMSHRHTFFRLPHYFSLLCKLKKMLWRISFAFQLHIWRFMLDVLITLLVILSLFSHSVGWISICSCWNCLACPVLPAMLWCHCQKPGFGWVKEDIRKKRNGTFEVQISLFC